MNKLKFLAAFVLIFTVFNFTSCDNEPLDSAIDPNPQPGCVPPTSFQASNFIGTNVNLSWATSTGATSWEVQYGPTGFAIGTGTSVFSETTNVTIPALVPTNTYHFYIRSNCSESEVSSWIGPISVGTSTGGTTGRALRMRIGGEDFVATDITAIKGSLLPGSFYFNITAITGSKVMTLTFQGTDNMNSFELPARGGITYVKNISDPLSVYMGVPEVGAEEEPVGNITITAEDMVNKKVSGTFNCKIVLFDSVTEEVIDRKQITNGVFTNIPYTIQ
ncbi:hypothetical protein ABH942_001663 [Flavobacterium sp. 28YEA47A]|uniref:DUF6252 family protein n=1 Tax=Flavobacterium sp. 28YEA47A TaxID=3156276 RepID=UPI003512CE7E